MGFPTKPENAAQLQGVPVSTTAPTDGQVLKYVAADGQWEPGTGGGGGDVTLDTPQTFTGLKAFAPGLTLPVSGGHPIAVAGTPVGGSDSMRLSFNGGETLDIASDGSEIDLSASIAIAINSPAAISLGSGNATTTLTDDGSGNAVLSSPPVAAGVNAPSITVTPAPGGNGSAEVPGVAATGTITWPPFGDAMTVGQQFVVQDADSTVVTFQIGNSTDTPGGNPFILPIVGGGYTGAQLASGLGAAFSDAGLNQTLGAADAVMSITDNTLGTAGNHAITSTIATAGFAHTGMSGGSTLVPGVANGNGANLILKASVKGTGGSGGTDGIAHCTSAMTVDGVLTASGGVAGNLTGNVTGNASGSSGSCTGNAATATTAAGVASNGVTAAALATGALRYLGFAGGAQGPLALPGAKVGDTVVGIIVPATGASPAGGTFEATISANDQIQQLTAGSLVGVIFSIVLVAKGG